GGGGHISVEVSTCGTGFFLPLAQADGSRTNIKLAARTAVWREAMVRHVLWGSARKSRAISYPRSEGLKCMYYATHARMRKQQILWYLTWNMAMRTPAAL